MKILDCVAKHATQVVWLYSGLKTSVWGLTISSCLCWNKIKHFELALVACHICDRKQNPVICLIQEQKAFQGHHWSIHIDMLIFFDRFKHLKHFHLWGILDPKVNNMQYQELCGRFVDFPPISNKLDRVLRLITAGLRRSYVLHFKERPDLTSSTTT